MSLIYNHKENSTGVISDPSLSSLILFVLHTIIQNNNSSLDHAYLHMNKKTLDFIEFNYPIVFELKNTLKDKLFVQIKITDLQDDLIEIYHGNDLVETITINSKQEKEITVNKIVISYGSFDLSENAVKLFKRLNPDHSCIKDGILEINFIPRHDKTLVEVVELLDHVSYGGRNELEIVEIEGNEYFIECLDGVETVKTPREIHWISIKSGE